MCFCFYYHFTYCPDFFGIGVVLLVVTKKLSWFYSHQIFKWGKAICLVQLNKSNIFHQSKSFLINFLLVPFLQCKFSIVFWSGRQFDFGSTCIVAWIILLNSLSYTDVSGIHKDIVIEPELADVTEGVAENFTCKVFHSCKKQTPHITWNYENMPETVETKPNRGSGLVTNSNVLFLASMEDHGKKLTCTAKFPYGEITASVVLYVQSE